MKRSVIPASNVSLPRVAGRLLACCATVLAAQANAQVIRSATPQPFPSVEVRIEASSSKTVEVLAAIGEIRADLQLQMLFMADGAAKGGSAYLSDARDTIWPKIKDTVLAAGGADIDPLLIAFEDASGKDEVTEAFRALETELVKTRALMQPTPGDIVHSVIAMATLAASKINPAGPTDVVAYQEAWSTLMTARGDLDLLVRNEDPGIKALAKDIGMAFDDLILFMPDPNQPAPVAFDPAQINDLVTRLHALAEAA